VAGQLLAFLGVSAVVICVPGPDTALTVRNALAGGRRCGVATAAGVAAGQAVWTLATGVGIAELVQASEPVFLAMKAVGATYLVALGLQSLWTAAHPDPAHRLRSPTGGPGTGPGGSGAGRGGTGTGPGGSGAGRGGTGIGPGGWWLGPGRALGQGLVSNLANPKMAAFFLSLLPQFASPEHGAGGVLGLGLVFCVMTFAWLGLYSAVVDRARRLLGRPGVRRALEGVSGLVLVGFGARLAVQQR
jgi:threonine/homoserine/homoserine lactone efflux protein